MRTRIVVADESEARFYDVEHLDTAPQLVARLQDPSARLHDRDFKSDRPGRVFDHAPASSGRRGAVSHHGTGGERRPRKHAAEQFAHRIADLLGTAHQQAQFERIIVVAGPPFLGVLREAFPPALRALVTVEVHKDLVHQDDRILRQHVSQALNPQAST